MKRFVAPFASRDCGPPPKPAPNCMHETMTRLYNSSFRCPTCFRPASMGWLYRCTVDKELVMDDDLEKGSSMYKLDALCDIFPLPEQPRPRSPGTRLSILSFLEEIADDQVEEYSQEQLKTLADQRSHLLDVLKGVGTKTNSPALFSSSSSRISTDRSSSPCPSKPTKKPWLPIPAECEFKICHTCRPTSVERSWLSIDAIVNDDAPATAITGYGFNLTRRRPVGLVKYVKNLGLRASPPGRPRDKAHQDHQSSRHRHGDGMGLGLFTSSPGSSRYSGSSSRYNPTHNPNPNPWITNPWEPLDAHSIDPQVTNTYTPIFPNPYGPPSPHPTSSSKPLPPLVSHSQDSFEPQISPSPYIRPARTFADLLTRPPPLPDRFNPPLNHLPSTTALQNSCMSAYAILTALPPQSIQERLDLEAGDCVDLGTPSAAQTEDESIFFGAGPVAVSGGVAVTEEAVGLRVADFMTQV